MTFINFRVKILKIMYIERTYKIVDFGVRMGPILRPNTSLRPTQFFVTYFRTLLPQTLPLVTLSFALIFPNFIGHVFHISPTCGNNPNLF